MKTIYKYTLPLEDTPVIYMKKDAYILTVQNQGDSLCLWAEVDPEEEPESRHFTIVGTGHPVPELHCYIGTVQQLGGNLVWHVYESIKFNK